MQRPGLPVETRRAKEPEGILTGQTLEGDVFAGQDAVTLVGNGWPA